MFAPSLGPTGRVIAFVTLIDGTPARILRELLHRAGADVVDVTAADHDRITAVSQAGNPQASMARAALCRSAERLAGLSSARQFSAITKEIRDYLGAEDLASLADACATLFGALGPPTGH
jgi:prephenate dehydrogenase